MLLNIAVAIPMAILAIILLWGGGYLIGKRSGLERESQLRSAHATQIAAARARTAKAEDALDKRLKKIVEESIVPLLGNASAPSPLTGLKSGTGRADLAGFLDAIAQKGEFEYAILSDSRGLLLASSADAPRAEIRAGVSALLVTVAQQIVRAGEATPVSFLVHDEKGRSAISRLFSVDGQRFLITVLASGPSVSPTVLDPALEQVEQLMHDWTSPYRDLAASGRPSHTS